MTPHAEKKGADAGAQRRRHRGAAGRVWSRSMESRHPESRPRTSCQPRARHGDGPARRAAIRCCRRAFAERGGEAVEVDREHDDAEAGFDALGQVDRRNRLDDFLAEAVGSDDAGDDRHRQREHDDLVDAGMIVASRAAAGCRAGSGPVWHRRRDRPRRSRSRRPGCRARSDAPGGQREDHGRHDAGHDADAEERDGGDEVAKAGIVCMKSRGSASALPAPWSFAPTRCRAAQRSPRRRPSRRARGRGSASR